MSTAIGRRDRAPCAPPGAEPPFDVALSTALDSVGNFYFAGFGGPTYESDWVPRAGLQVVRPPRSSAPSRPAAAAARRAGIFGTTLDLLPEPVHVQVSASGDVYVGEQTSIRKDLTVRRRDRRRALPGTGRPLERSRTVQLRSGCRGQSPCGAPLRERRVEVCAGWTAAGTLLRSVPDRQQRRDLDGAVQRTERHHGRAPRACVRRRLAEPHDPQDHARRRGQHAGGRCGATWTRRRRRARGAAGLPKCDRIRSPRRETGVHGCGQQPGSSGFARGTGDDACRLATRAAGRHRRPCTAGAPEPPRGRRCGQSRQHLHRGRCAQHGAQARATARRQPQAGHDCRQARRTGLR